MEEAKFVLNYWYNWHLPAPVAQWIEYLTSNQMVGSSNLSGGTSFVIANLFCEAISSSIS